MEHEEDEFFTDDESFEYIGALIVMFLGTLLMLGAIWRLFA
jgi:hypothetical protein